MNEDDSARREFVFGLFLITIVTPLIAGLTVFAAILGALFLSEGLAARRQKPDSSGQLSPPRSATQRALRHTSQRHSRRAVSTRRPGGVPH